MIKKTLQYDTEKFEISQDFWNQELTKKTESMMALGNGYLGLRSADEGQEQYNTPGLYVNGVFNKPDDKTVTELVNLADSMLTNIFIDGKRIIVSDKVGYLKTLSIKNGFLQIKLDLKLDNKEFVIKKSRVVSNAQRNLYAQKISIIQTKGDASQILIEPKINGRTTNHGSQHFKEGDKKRPTGVSIQYFEETNESNILVGHNMILRPSVNGKQIQPISDDFTLFMERRRIGFRIKAEISVGSSFRLEKMMSVVSSFDEDIKTHEAVYARTTELHDQLLNVSFEDILNESNKSLEEKRSVANVKIIGDSDDAKYDRLALEFSKFHMNSFVPKTDPRLSIGAKGLSGEGYQGHTFWDTEFFINPNYLFVKPQIVRNLLEYRYLGIKGARDKAMEVKERYEESKLQGAQYPWEAANPKDGEVCPYWGQPDVETGEQVPVASRRQEIHVSADVAFAVDQYFNVTGDQEFMETMGYEMIIDTAIFWSQRAEETPENTYVINDVMGPNEFKGNINNNAFINAMAKKNLDLAIYYIDQLRETHEGRKKLLAVNKKLPYSYSVHLMREVSELLKQQTPNKDGIIAENDTFLQLPKNDLKEFQLLGDAGKKLFNTKKGQVILSSQVVKQADVVLLTFLLSENFTLEEIEKNWDYYESITTHDSSLSATTYAIQAIRLRKTEQAYKLFKYSLDIDMGPNMKSCDEGIHAGAIAAIWQNVIFGYGGVRHNDGNLHINPILPEAWEGLEFSIIYKGASLDIKTIEDTFTITCSNKKEIDIYINHELVTINSKTQTFKVVKHAI